MSNINCPICGNIINIEFDHIVDKYFSDCFECNYCNSGESVFKLKQKIEKDREINEKRHFIYRLKMVLLSKFKKSK